MFRDGYFRPSPDCRVEMLGFESTTQRLAAHGWEIQIDDQAPSARSPFGGRVLAMRHPKSAVIAFAHQVHGDLMSGAYHPGEEVLFEINKILHDKCLVEALPSLSYRRIDASPGWPMRVGEMKRDERRTLESLGMFKAWEDEVEEIIVDQASVSELMDRIRQLQEPELAAIRERNRARDRRSQMANEERVRAQVISIAA